jgi:hypothetical protein
VPAKSSWLQRVPEIIETISAMDVPVVDRAICERLFGVRRRRAIDLMQRFGGYRSGNTILLDRTDLIRQLQVIGSRPEVLWEQQRKAKLSDRLQDLRRYRIAEQVVIRGAKEVQPVVLRRLPTGVALRPGELTVHYGNLQELLSRLYDLAQAAAGDFEWFSDIIDAAGKGDCPAE